MPHFAIANKVVDDSLSFIDGNSKTNPLGLFKNSCIYPNQRAINVKEGTATITGVD